MEPIRIAFWLGIGDCHWPCQKLKGLRKFFGGRPIHAYVNRAPNHDSVGYLRLIPHIERAEFSTFAPKFLNQLAPDYREPKWATLEGSANWCGFDYVFNANAWMEAGKPIADWMPELETEYSFDYRINDLSLSVSHRIMPEPRVLLHLCNEKANRYFHGMWWGLDDWADVIRRLNDRDIIPMIVGAGTVADLSFVNRLATECAGIQFVSAAGRTTIAEIVDMLRRCRLFIGLNAGLGIVSASMGTPTLIMWADNRWPVGEISFDQGMQTAWLCSSQRDAYRTFSYGSPEMTAENVMQQAMEIIR